MTDFFYVSVKNKELHCIQEFPIKSCVFRGRNEVFAIGRTPRSRTEFDQWARRRYFGAQFKRSEVPRVVCAICKAACFKGSAKYDRSECVIFARRKRQNHLLKKKKLFGASLSNTSGARRNESLLLDMSLSTI